MTRLIIIGGGRMAATHAAAFKAIAGVQLVGLVETDPGRRAAFAAEHAIPNQFDDLDSALAWGQFDAAANVTPDAMHYDTTMQLIAAGKHVFCEKPLATEYAKARELTDAAQQAGIINMVNLTFRSMATLNKAHEIAASGALGNIRHFEASCLQSWLVGNYWGDWQTEQMFLWRLSSAHGSKGAVGDLGIHIVDAATYAAASDIASMSPRTKTFDKAPGGRIGEYVFDANDSFIAIAELNNGALGTIQATRFATGFANELRIVVHGDKGALLLQGGAEGDKLSICQGADVHTNAWKVVDCPPVLSNYQKFAAAIASGINGDPDFARAAIIQQALDRIIADGAAPVSVLETA
ncbi:Gfo/Idh/MocA family protein [uncultured Devosia sp.]|uniref:Gfo/Idh/MocA family protein n=1 Tax=uncultured Devosia sp. TaxID=211434 RepID=UPI0035CA932A